MVGSERHYSMLKQACEDVGVECLGYLKRNDKLQIPSRHLGLSIMETEKLETLINAAADEVVEHVNMERICGY
jgi:cobyrinic acid a,c-diamide synthase